MKNKKATKIILVWIVFFFLGHFVLNLDSWAILYGWIAGSIAFGSIE